MGNEKIKVLVISDTHRNARILEDVMNWEKSVDYVLHMGDLESQERYIRELTNCPFQAVQGNCDFGSDWPVETMVEIGGHKIFMTHGHRYQVGYDTYMLEDMARGCGADIAMYGHTHIPHFEKKEDGFVILNPGSLGSPRQPDRKPSYMIMEINRQTGEVMYFQKGLKRRR